MDRNNNTSKNMSSEINGNTFVDVNGSSITQNTVTIPVNTADGNQYFQAYSTSLGKINPPEHNVTLLGAAPPGFSESLGSLSMFDTQPNAANNTKPASAMLLIADGTSQESLGSLSMFSTLPNAANNTKPAFPTLQIAHGTSQDSMTCIGIGETNLMTDLPAALQNTDGDDELEYAQHVDESENDSERLL